MGVHALASPPATRSKQGTASMEPMALAPLEGFRVGITADRRREELADLLQRRGATTIVGPTLETRLLPDDAALEAATRDLIAHPPDVVVATTGVGVRSWFEAAQAWGLADALRTACESAHVAARGPKAVAAVQVAGLPVGATAKSERLTEIAAMVRRRGVRGLRVAVQLHGEDDLPLVDDLRDGGAEVVPLPVYRWGFPADREPARRLVGAVADRTVDAVTFTSAPAVRNLFTIADETSVAAEFRAAFASDVVAACVGPVCADSARAAGIPEPVYPRTGRLGLLVRTVCETLQGRTLTRTIGTLEVACQGNVVAVGPDVSVALSPRERALFRVLCDRPGLVVARAQLLREVWGSAGPDLHSVDVAVTRLRRRLAPTGLRVVAVRGRGYRLE